MDSATWFSLPLVDEPLVVTHIGNGKDADMVIEFTSGRRIVLGVSHTRVETDRGIVVDVSAQTTPC